MVEDQLVGRGLRSPTVLAAMRSVPRHVFVSSDTRAFAYDDRPLPIGSSQTISQPYIVAYMTELLEPCSTDNVLEIGTGSGYAAAVLGQIAQEVYTVERHPELARSARGVFKRLEYDNIFVRVGDGTLGWSEHAPYDKIVVAAAGPQVPESLTQQLIVGGRLVMPVGERLVQNLVRVTRVSEDAWETEQLSGVRFVPLLGEEGWRDR